MKRYLVLFTLIILWSCLSCCKFQDKAQNKSNITAEKMNQDKNTPIKYANYDLIKKLSIKEAINEYPPISQNTYILGKGPDGFVSEFRVGLLNKFNQEDIRRKDIRITEITWETSNKENLTVWYHKQDKSWAIVDYLIWNKNANY